MSRAFQQFDIGMDFAISFEGVEKAECRVKVARPEEHGLNALGLDAENLHQNGCGTFSESSYFPILP